MKISSENINSINESFAKMQNIGDFAVLLSEAKNMLYGEETELIQRKRITYYANSQICKKRYKKFEIKKKSGSNRVIQAPIDGLKTIQRSLNFVLQCIYEPHKAAMGFVKDKSIVDNANIHKGMNYVYNIDLKDYFSSIELHRVKAVLKLPPFSLNNDRESLAFLIANLVCNEQEVERIVEGSFIKVKKSVLPQGAPTSPTISNIISKRMDNRLSGLAKRFGVKYSRYADDITFSSLHNVYQEDSEFIKELKRIITDQGFIINPKKTRLQKNVHRQEVTGLIVNEKVNVRKRYIKQIRMWIYYWEKYGYEKAESIFLRDYFLDKGHIKNGRPNMDNVIGGKLEYLKMVKGDNDSTYLKLKSRFEKLIGYKDILSNIIDIWEEKGIEEAMKIYYTGLEKKSYGGK